MKLISVVSNYQILEAILLKILKLNNDDVILLISDYLANKYPNHLILKDYFKDIIPFSISIKYNNDGLEDKIPYFNQLFKKYGYKITDFKEIYCAAAHHSFGVYLSQLQQEFIFLEDGAGIISAYESLLQIEKNINNQKALAIEEMGLFSGTSKYIQYIIADKNKFCSDYKPNRKCIHFSIKEALEQINEQDMHFITVFFGFQEKIYIPDNSCIIFTEHFTNLKIFSYEYQCRIYQYLVDYFFQSYNIIFKPHPDDIAYYSLLFPDAKIIKTKFPAEIFPYIITKSPEYLAGISTTSIHNLDYINSKIFSLDFNARYNQVVDSFHKYYITAKLLNIIRKNTVIYTNNIYKLLLNKMLEFHTKEFTYSYTENIDECDIAIFDGIILQSEIIKIQNTEICIFLCNPFEFIDKNLIYKNIYPIQITKTKKENNEFVFDKCLTEYIYIYINYPKEENINFMHEFELKNTGIILNAETLSDDKLEIAILKGILEATEKRLIDEIEIKNNMLNNDDEK